MLDIPVAEEFELVNFSLSRKGPSTNGTSLSVDLLNGNALEKCKSLPLEDEHGERILERLFSGTQSLSNVLA